MLIYGLIVLSQSGGSILHEVNTCTHQRRCLTGVVASLIHRGTQQRFSPILGDPGAVGGARESRKGRKKKVGGRKGKEGVGVTSSLPFLPPIFFFRPFLLSLTLLTAPGFPRMVFFQML